MKVTFFRSAQNANGTSYKAPLMSVAVPDSLSEDQAVVGAIKQFQEHMKVSNWQELAEFYEVT